MTPASAASPARSPSLCPTCGHPLSTELRGLRIDHEARAVIIDNHVITLTSSHFDVLSSLIDAMPRALRKERLHHLLYGRNPDGGAEIKIIDVFVCKIRRELRGTRLEIETLWGEGYRVKLKELTDDPAA